MSCLEHLAIVNTSTYRAKISASDLSNKELKSTLNFEKSNMSKMLNSSIPENQTRGACISPYRAINHGYFSHAPQKF
jgi:hypothetical protein